MDKTIARLFVILPLLTLMGCTAPKSELKDKASTVLTSEQSCINEFKALRNIDPVAYNVYQAQFSTLNATYDVYRKNEAQINKDSKEILGIELNNKLKLICARVKGASFKSMEKRSVEINNL